MSLYWEIESLRWIIESSSLRIKFQKSLLNRLLEPRLLLVIVAGVFIFCVGLIAFLYVRFDSEKAGQVVDSFGILTSFFSGITVIGLLITIYLQRRDLEIARRSLRNQIQELKQTRNQIKISNTELAFSRKEFQKQNQTL
jgi:hypothetical protein